MDDLTDMAGLRLSIDHGPPAVIRVTGDVDIDSSSVLESAVQEVLATGAGELRFDLSEVGFMDSSGLAVLVRANNVIGAVVGEPSPAVRVVLEATGLQHLVAGEP